MKVNTLTIGYNNIQEKNKLKISAFYADIKDEIYYYSAPTFVASANTNLDKSHKYGVDIYDKLIIHKKLNLVLNYNYVQAIIDKEEQRDVNGTITQNYAGKKLPGVSNHNVKATFSYLPNEKTRLALTQIYRSEAYAANDFNNNFKQKQDAYYSTDISINYTEKKYELFAKANNIFGKSNGLWIKDDTIYPVNFARTFIAGFTLKY